MTIARARQFLKAVVAHDFQAAEELLDPDVETVTPRGTLRGIPACRQVLQKASGDEQFELEQAEPEFEEIDGDVIARTREIARWRETGEVAYQREFAVRLTLDGERVVRVVVMPKLQLSRETRGKCRLVRRKLIGHEVVGMDRTDTLSSVPQTQSKANRAA